MDDNIYKLLRVIIIAFAICFVAYLMFSPDSSDSDAEVLHDVVELSPLFDNEVR